MPGRFRLEHFLPYRLSVLSNVVSSKIARLYDQRFKLSTTEWRVMAILASHPGISARTVAELSAMDKVAVSRAVAKLIRADRVAKQTATDDRRKSVLSLTPEGKRIHAIVVPAARACETELLTCLTSREAATLNKILNKLERRAQQFDP
ncbi:MAG: MarR family transcriptional regulator [Lysobacteraceae bacterium]|nr:MAG: MarR family transcriptional regulator [Xanthomonadaceae bacterium]